MGGRLPISHGFTSYEDHGNPFLESKAMESCTPLSFLKEDVGRNRTTPIPGPIFRGDLRRAQEKRDLIRKNLPTHGSPSQAAVAKQNEALSEGKRRVYGAKGERDPLFSPTGFLSGSSEKNVG